MASKGNGGGSFFQDYQNKQQEQKPSAATAASPSTTKADVPTLDQYKASQYARYMDKYMPKYATHEQHQYAQAVEKTDKFNQAVDYLNSGNTDSKTTQRYLDEANKEAKNTEPTASNAELHNKWMKMANALEEQRGIDTQREQAQQVEQEKQASAANYRQYQDDIQKLQQEGQTRSQIWVDGIYMGEDKQIADSYAKRIADLQEKAEKERQAAGDAIGLNTGEAIGANLEHGTWHGVMGIGQAGAAEVGKGISSDDANSFFGRSAAANQGKLNQEYGEQLKSIWNGDGSVRGKLKDTLFSTYHFGMQSMEKGAARNDAIYVGQNAMNYLLRKWALPNITGSDDADANAAWLTGKAYDATDKLTDKVSEWEPMKYVSDEKLQSAMKSSSGGAKLAGQVSDVIGRMLPSMAVSWATKDPDAGRLVMAQSAGGAAAAEAYRNGATAEQAYYIGREKGFIEWLSEGLFEGIGLLGGGVLSDGMKKVLGDFALTKLGRVLTKAGDILGENAEEAASDWADPGVDKAVLGQLPEGEEDLSMIQALLGQAPWTEQGLITLMSTLVLGGISDVSQNGMHRVNQEQAQEILTIAQNSGNERLASLAAEYADLIEKRGSMGAKQFSEFAEATKKRIGEQEFERKLQEQRQKAENQGANNMAMFGDPATGLSADQLTLAKTPDSAAMDGMKTNAAAWLSAKLSGAETGESILGNYTDPAFIEDLPDGAKQAAQAFASTEGAEAAVQNIMNYVAEIAAQTQGEWDDAKSNAAAGYVLGTLSNLFQGGQEVDQKRQQSIAEEAAEFARRGLTIDEAIAEAQQTAQKSITAKPAMIQTAQRTNTVAENGWTWDNWMQDALSGGALSDEDVDMIYRKDAARAAFEKATNSSLEGLSEEEAKSRIGMAAGTTAKTVMQEQAQETPTEVPESDPVREWVNSRQEAQNAAEGGLNSTESKNSKKPSKVDKNLEKLVLDRLRQKAKDGTLKRGTVSFDGGELNGQKVDGVDQNNLTKQQKSAVKAAEAVATALGLDIVFFSDKAKDGNIKLGAWQGDKLYLNLDGAIRANRNGQSISRFIVGATLSHELTHYLQKYDQEGYAELRDFVEKTILKKDAGSMERMIQQQIAMDPSLSPDEAMDEVVANACQGMLYDNKVVQQLARQNMSLVEKIIDIFDSVGNRLKGAFAEVNLDDSDIYRAARLMKGDMADLRNIWNRDLLTATENFQNQQGQEKTAQEGGKAQFMAVDENNNVIVDEDVTPEKVFNTLKSIHNNEVDSLDFTFPVLKHTPPIYRHYCDMDDRSFVMPAKKAKEAMQAVDENSAKHKHGLSPSEMMDVINRMDKPDAIIEEHTPGNEGHHAVLFKNDDGEVVAAVDIGNWRSGSGAVAGEEGWYNTLVTAYDELLPWMRKKYNSFEEYVTSLYEAPNIVQYDKDVDGEYKEAPEDVALSGTQLRSSSGTSSTNNIAGAAGVVKNPHAKFQQYNADGVGNDLDTLSKITDKDGKAQFQVAAFENDEPEYRSMLAQAGWKESDIDTLFEKVNKAIEVIKDNQEALDYAWDADIDDRAFNPVKQNSDKLYKVSQDFSTLCRKRILQGVIAGELSSALQRGLTKEEGIAVRDALMALQKEGKQIEVACALCYVESARMRSQKAIQEFLNNREASIRNYFAGKQGKEAESAAEAAERNAIYEELGMIRGKGDDATMYDVRDPKTATMKVLPTNIKKRIQEAKKKARASYPLTDEQQRLVDEANKLPVTAFTTPEGLQELAKNNRDLFNAFVLKVSAASKSKGIENDTWWRAGDSKSISDLLIEQMNAENGLRTQSWSDFQVKHLMDYIAATIELSTRKAKQHAYTKVLDYVELMGDTGVMINMSLIPTADYNGKLEFDDVEGFKYKEAMRMRNKFPDTAGTICIGMDNDQIHQLLESDEIDYVIPYHQSGMSKATRAAMHIPAWKDFQSFQGEKKLSGDAAAENAAKYGVKLLDESDKKWHEGPSFSEWFDLGKARETAAKYGKSGKYGVMTGGYMAMQEAAENYKRICAERGLQPKFSYGKADFSEDANYWKLLIDRKMVNNKTGEIIEQKAIQPNFNMDTIQRILDDELERYGNVKADQDEAIQRVTEAVMSGKVKGGMSSDEIAEAMQKPIDNLAITAATQGQTYNADIFDPVETLTEKPKQTGTKKTQNAKSQDTADILAETATGKTGKNGTKLNWNDRSSGKEKTSEYYSNTATKNGKAKELNETNFKYVPIPEQKSIRRAATKVANNYDQVLADLYGNRTWLSEQVDAAWLISDKLHNEAVATGTKEAWDAYNKFEELIQDHATEAGAALQAFAKQSRPGSAAVMRAAQARINAIREARAEAEKAGKTKGLVSEEALKKAEEKTREYATRMGKLEYEIDQKIKGGMSEETARNEAKNAYLDLIDEINTFRHTGLLQDAGKQADAREAAKANKEVKKLNTKFRKMLEKEDMEYIMRFAATDMAGISSDTQYDGKQDFLKRLNTWQKLAQLTGTGTWLRNGVGNGSFGIVDVLAADNPVTILADALLSAKTGKRSSGFETGILNKVARDAAAHSLRRSILEVAANIDIDSESEKTKYDMGTTRTYDPDSENVLTRIGSRWEQWNGYMLQSSDAWFKGMAKGSAEAAIRKANHWDKGNLTKAERASMDKDKAEKLSKKRQAEIDETVRQIAEYRTFQNDSMLSKGADKAREGLNKFGAGLLGRKWQQGQFGLGTALMPYTKVPTNLAMKAVEFSPAGALNGLREMIQVMNNPKATMAQQQKAVTDFGRGVTGTALVAVMASLMKQFKFFRDWDDEDDKDVKAQNRAEGKYGMQFNIDMIKRWANGDKNPTWENDDRTLDISSMEPLNQLIGAASLLADDEEITAKGILEAFTKAAHDSLNNMPALQTLANIENTIRYTDTPDDLWQTLVTTAASTAGNVAGGMIPAPIKHYAALTDENVRDTSGKNATERAVNQAKSAIPGLRQTLPVKRDAFGNEMKAGDFATRFANQYDAFKHTQVNQSDVSRELERLREETGVSRMPSRNGPSSITFGSGKDKETIKLKGQERTDYKNVEGSVTNMTLEELFGLPLYKNADSDTQDAMVAELESFAKDTTKGYFADYNDIDYEGEYTSAREAEDPIAFLTAKTGFNLAKGANDWDAVDELIKTVRAGRLSEAEQDVYEEHMQGFKKLYAMAGSGIGSKRVTDFADALKAQYESEKRTDARGSDYIRTACSGKFTDKEADTFMSYAPDISPKTIDNYREQVQYQLSQAGMSDVYDGVWDGIEQVVNGDIEKSVFTKWVDKNVPIQYRQELKDICTNYAKDRHEAGKTVYGIYDSVRAAGFSPKEALAFYEAIDANYNGSLAKGEYKRALRQVFGDKAGREIWNNMKEHGVQYVTGRY